MATKANTKDMGDNTEEANDAPLAGGGNLADAIKKLLKKGKERGHVTLDELNAILPPERISSEMIEDVMAQLNDMGINVVEGEESEDDPENSTEKASEAEDYGRTDDPVRLYLREMGAVELLSREGEIAIAKRIEAGREMMISGICESPLTIQAILDWNEALKAGRLLLRDIIDLDATQDSPETAAESPGVAAADANSGDAETDAAVRKDADDDGDTAEGGAGDGSDSSFEDEDNISLAAIEEKLKPQVIETFDAIAATYVKLNKLQHQRLVAIEKGEQPNKSNDGKISGHKEQLVELVRTVRFNNARLEQLVQQLYTLNRRLMGLEGRLLRYGLDVQLTRDEFLERYYEHELDPNWFDYILLPPPPRAIVKAAPKLVENATERVLAHAHRQREATAAAAAQQKIIDDKAAAKAQVAQAKKDEAARVRAEAADAKQKARDAASAAKAAEKDKAAKAAAAVKEAAARQKAKDQAARQKAAEAAARLREREAAARQKAKDQAAANKAREQARELAARQKLVAKKAPIKSVAKPAAKSASRPALKKPAPKPAAKPAVKKAAQKQAAKKAPSARKPATKAPVRKAAAPKRTAANPAAKKAAPKKAAVKTSTKSNSISNRKR